MNHVGVDGCKAGWIAITKDGNKLKYKLFSTVSELLLVFSRATRVLIDIPIGLPWSDVPIRPCDRLARAALGERRYSVFPVPCRSAVHAETVVQAREINNKVLARSLSKQTWGICRKIAEVDTFLTGERPTYAEIREVHPEVCFWALAGRSPMKYNKKNRGGIDERIALLSKFEPETERFLVRILDQELRKNVRADDVLAALVAFVTSCVPSSQLRSLRGLPVSDEKGLPMEMVYVDQ